VRDSCRYWDLPEDDCVIISKDPTALEVTAHHTHRRPLQHT
jgi:hypothetical protein